MDLPKIKLLNFRPTLFCFAALIMAVVSSYFIFVKESVITGVLILSAFILLFIVLPIIVCAVKRKDKLKTAFIFSAVIMILSAAAFC